MTIDDDDFFRTIEGDYGYQFCDWGNPNCPEEFGPKILPDNTKYLTTKDNWTYFLITKDLGKTNCIRRTVFELYPKYTFSNEIEAILWNVCNKFVEDVLKKCKV